MATNQATVTACGRKSMSGVWGFLTVIDYSHTKNKRALWNCRCRCGLLVKVSGKELRSGHTKSCGCVKAERIAAFNRTHGATNGRKEPPEYRTWKDIRRRCMDKKRPQYKDYGGRGITICDRWADYANFLADMGPRPSPGHSIDRYPDNDGNYEPGNCRWATRHQQAQNTRRNRLLTFQGETLCVKAWARKLGIFPQTIYNRLNRGCSPSQALAPVRSAAAVNPGNRT